MTDLPSNRTNDRPAVDSVVALRVSFTAAFRYWLKLGFINFGGPAGQIALMHRDLVCCLRAGDSMFCWSSLLVA